MTAATAPAGRCGGATLPARAALPAAAALPASPHTATPTAEETRP